MDVLSKKDAFSLQSGLSVQERLEKKGFGLIRQTFEQRINLGA